MKKLTTVVLSMCLAVGAASVFAADTMSNDSMSKDSMSKDAMKKDAMKKTDSMSKDAMSKGSMSKDSMKKDAMSKDAMKKAKCLSKSNHRRPCGGLLAKAAYQSTLIATDTTPSRASSLPQVFCRPERPEPRKKTSMIDPDA
ncbi:hypothetical protein PputUW4_01918 [Pseudomonas sp. UW4]|nr:hypothetical protein PputUW4_01918 [Pseudomonas sp. UW4]